jgi:Domain of unknown function (DUF3854)
MNATLALLLSNLFPGDLEPEHRADLEKSGLTDATIQAHFIRSIPPMMIDALLGFAAPEIRSALLYPFRTPAGGFADHVFLKRFPPGRDRRGHTVKYLTRKGATPRLYFTQPHREAACNTDRPIWLVEGLKQSLALAQLGDLVTVGFCGIEGWHVKGSTELLPDFDAIPLRGRIVEILPDSDFQTNADVERGVRRFGAALAARGARPRIRLLPTSVEPRA